MGALGMGQTERLGSPEEAEDIAMSQQKQPQGRSEEPWGIWRNLTPARAGLGLQCRGQRKARINHVRQSAGAVAATLPGKARAREEKT